MSRSLNSSPSLVIIDESHSHIQIMNARKVGKNSQKFN
jgi:ABC-type bacteriocin/lantibiotic exporter with double-glycine peptidase domain